MGLFDHLFKTKSPSGEEKVVESPQEEPTKPADVPAKSPIPQRADPSAFLHPKNYVPRGAPGLTPAPRPAASSVLRPPERRTTPTGPPPAADEIVLTLGDVLSRIPTHYLKQGSHDPKRELRFKINDLSSDIARGRAAVPLSRIAQLMPDIFVKEIGRDEDTEVRLPLQKLVEQIGLLRSRPKAPTPDKLVRPAGAEAPAGSRILDIEVKKDTPPAPAPASSSPVGEQVFRPVITPPQAPPIILGESALGGQKSVELKAAANQSAPVFLGPARPAEPAGPPAATLVPVAPMPVSPEPEAFTPVTEAPTPSVLPVIPEAPTGTPVAAAAPVPVPAPVPAAETTVVTAPAAVVEPSSAPGSEPVAAMPAAVEPPALPAVEQAIAEILPEPTVVPIPAITPPRAEVPPVSPPPITAEVAKPSEGARPEIVIDWAGEAGLASEVVGPTKTPETAVAPTPAESAVQKLAPLESPQIESGEEMIQLSLAAILRHCPQEIIFGQLPHVDDSVRISLPFAPIDRQLVKGQVEVTALRFVAALPEAYQKNFVAKVGVKVPIPLEEVFQNLPSPTHELKPAPAAPPPLVLAPATTGVRESETQATSETPEIAAAALAGAGGTAIIEAAEAEKVAPEVPEAAVPALSGDAPSLVLPSVTPGQETPVEGPKAEVIAPVSISMPDAPVPATAAEPTTGGPADATESTPTAADAGTTATQPPPLPSIEALPVEPPPLPTSVADEPAMGVAAALVGPGAAEAAAGSATSGVAEEPISVEAVTAPVVPAMEAPAAQIPPVSEPAPISEPLEPVAKEAGASDVNSAPSAEPPKLVLQRPVFRPFVVPPPPIFGFTPSPTSPAAEAEAAPPVEAPPVISGLRPADAAAGEPVANAPAVLVPTSVSAPMDVPISIDVTKAEAATLPIATDGEASVVSHEETPVAEAAPELTAVEPVGATVAAEPTAPAEVVTPKTPTMEEEAQPSAEQISMSLDVDAPEIAPFSLELVPFADLTETLAHETTYAADLAEVVHLDQPVAEKQEVVKPAEMTAETAPQATKLEESAPPTVEGAATRETLAPAEPVARDAEHGVVHVVEEVTAVAAVAAVTAELLHKHEDAPAKQRQEVAAEHPVAEVTLREQETKVEEPTAVKEPAAANEPLPQVEAPQAAEELPVPTLVAPEPVAPPPPAAEPPSGALPPPIFPLHRVPVEPAVVEVLPPSLPQRRFDHDAVQALFMTEETLDLPKISRLAASLPGVYACVIATRDQACTGGTLPEGFDLAALLGLAPRVGEAAGRMPIGQLKHFTLYGDRYSVSFFERNGLSLCAVHRPRSFVPGVREKLVALADELSR